MRKELATLGPDRVLRFEKQVKLTRPLRVLVTFLEPSDEMSLLSEPALAKEWDRPEENEAWQHLQFDPV